MLFCAHMYILNDYYVIFSNYAVKTGKQIKKQLTWGPKVIDCTLIMTRTRIEMGQGWGTGGKVPRPCDCVDKWHTPGVHNLEWSHAFSSSLFKVVCGTDEMAIRGLTSRSWSFTQKVNELWCMLALSPNGQHGRRHSERSWALEVGVGGDFYCGADGAAWAPALTLV